MSPKIKRCRCDSPKLSFKRYVFEEGKRSSYKGTCKKCGLVCGWYDAENYKLIVTGNSPKGGENTT